MYENNIVIFIYQIQYLLYNKNIPSINHNFINSINVFIMLYHKEYEEHFNYLYKSNLISELLEEEFMPLPEEYLINLLSKYKDNEDYIKLIDSLDSNTIYKISELVYKFIEYLEEAIIIYNKKIPTYSRILQ